MKKLVRIKVIALVDVQEDGGNSFDWFTPSIEHNLLKYLCEDMCKVESEISAAREAGQFAKAEVIEAVEEK